MIRRKYQNVAELRGILHFLLYTFFLMFQTSSKDIYSFYDQRKKAMHAIKIFFPQRNLEWKIL